MEQLDPQSPQMSPLSTPEHQDPTPQSFTPTQPPVPKKPSLSLVLGGILLAVVLVGGGVVLGQRTQLPAITKTSLSQTGTGNPGAIQEASNTSAPAQTSPKPTSKLTEVDAKTWKYSNSLGFSFTFPKEYNEDDDCAGAGAPPTREYKVFEDLEKQTLFISKEYVSKRADSSCSYVPNSLDFLRNGIYNDPLDNRTIYPYSLQVNYRAINQEQDLQRLIDSYLSNGMDSVGEYTDAYKGCLTGSKIPSKIPSVYNVELHDTTGKKGWFDAPSSCVINFKMYFLYSPKNKVALLTSGSQEAFFNGTNDQAEPLFEFP